MLADVSPIHELNMVNYHYQ